MNLENNIASHPGAISPQMRYATLHRSIEKGMHGDSTYVELVKVCVQLEKHEEAVRTFEKVTSPRERFQLQNLLLNHHVIDQPLLNEPCGSGPERWDGKRTLKDEALGAFHFLMQEHMPLTTITLTVAFPIVTGLGGFISQKIHAGWLANIAILPALLALAVICAVARRILLDARRGLDDAPSLAGSRDLLLEGAFALGDTLVLGALLLGPGIVMTQLDVPLPATLAALGLGVLLLPMALMLRLVRCDWRALHPQLLFTTIVKGGVPYLTTAAVIAAMLVPALACAVTISNSRFYLWLSMIGPLVVAPIFVAARLLGRLVDPHGERLGAFALETDGAPAPQEDSSLVRIAKVERKRPAPARLGGTPIAKKLEATKAGEQQRGEETPRVKRIAGTPVPAPLQQAKPARPAAAAAPRTTPQLPAARSTDSRVTPRPAAVPPLSPAQGMRTPPPRPDPKRTDPKRPEPRRPAPPGAANPAPLRYGSSARYEAVQESAASAPAELPPELARIPGLVALPGSSRVNAVRR